MRLTGQQKMPSTSSIFSSNSCSHERFCSDSSTPASLRVVPAKIAREIESESNAL